MEPAARTLRILQEIRDDLRGVREDLQRSTAESKSEREEMRAESNARFEVLETTLRDLAQQMVMLGRGVKIAIEARAPESARIDALDRRVTDLEKRTG